MEISIIENGDMPSCNPFRIVLVGEFESIVRIGSCESELIMFTTPTPKERVFMYLRDFIAMAE